MSHTIGEARAVPQNALEQLLALIGKGASSGRESMNNIFRHTKSGVGLGNLLFGESPEMLDEMSWGKSPIIPSGHGGRLDPRMADIAGIAAPAGIAAKRFVKEGIKDLFTTHPQSQAQGGYIVGIQSNLADTKKLKKAYKMKFAKSPTDEIFKETGWWFGHPDGKPRFEISHGNEKILSRNKILDELLGIEAKLLDDTGSLKDEVRRTQLLDLINDEGLIRDKVRNSPIQKQYPDLFNSMKFAEETRPGMLGRMKHAKNGEPGEMWLKETGDSIKDKQSFQHEMQHAIGKIEGFAPGGSSSHIEEYMKEVTQEIVNRIEGRQGIRNAKTQRLLDESLDVLEKFKREDVGFRPYRALSDESQARLVEKRSHLSQETMDEYPFYKHYPVKPENMVDMSKSFKQHKHSDYLKMRDQVMKHVK